MTECQHDWKETEETIRDDGYCNPSPTKDTQGHVFVDRTIQVTKKCRHCGTEEVTSREEKYDEWV